MRQVFRVVVCVLSMFGGAAVADGGPGKSLYATCAACHGENGAGNAALKAPNLAHLDATYIAAQLHKFRNGQRGAQGATSTARQMAGMASTLADDQAVLEVARYIDTLEPVAAAATTVQGDAKLGGDYFNQFCGACHGAAAEGNRALHSPPLAGADDWYLLEQLTAFRTGTRGSHPEDRTGRQMRAMAAVLPSDQAVKDVVAFIASLKSQ